MNREIRDLQEKIKIEQNKINSCDHDFYDPVYNPETVKEGYGSKMITQGSDVWYDYEGYRDVKKDRWTRTCKNCMYEQHTYSQKPIVSGSEPDFK